MTLKGELVSQGERAVAVEVPVQVGYADVSFAVMMLTPADLEDFAYGFSLTEGMIDTAADIRNVTLGQAAEGLTCRIDLVGQKLHQHLARQRAMTGRTGCGVCGIDDLDALKRAAASGATAPTVEIAAIERALSALDDRQVLNAATRAVHAAAWADASGAILHIREDVGRHNALDKLIGALLRAGVAPLSGFIVITSRCSFEMVEKAVTFGARTLVAISAPTSLAIERARALDLAMIAIARRDTVTIFNGAERVLTSTPALQV
ncbi:formate dehydrogenase accessory sulfurtransferase FdhD [Beijerinckia sp. L45]|uniref:formate dehydrogenase accessory sulfurtransferase FdhD n=1 Tax=Beijerinckia sp. L45 TaxID=1641855 RepID=UPI001FF07594|nr:formate dehydrogenase accessory sulfurtransferase FdhD [Beijerinckia sp. L45]